MKYAHYIVETAAFLAGLFVLVSLLKSNVRTRKSIALVSVFMVILTLGVVTDSVCWYLAEHKINNWWVFHLYTLAETVVLLLFLQYVIAGNKSNSKGAYLLFLNIGLVLAWITLNLVGEKFGHYATQIAAAYGFVLAVVGMMAFASLRLAVPRSRFFQTPETWFLAGIIIYHSATFFLFLSVPMFTTPEAQQKLLIVWGSLQATTSVLKHSSYIYGFMLCRKTLLS